MEEEVLPVQGAVQGGSAGAVDAVEYARPSGCTCVACIGGLRLCINQKRLPPRARAPRVVGPADKLIVGVGLVNKRP